LSAGSLIPRSDGSYFNWDDEIHLVTITVTNPDTSLTIGFGSTLGDGPTDESWGVDDLHIFVAHLNDLTGFGRQYAIFDRPTDRLTIEGGKEINLGNEWSASATFTNLLANDGTWRTLFRGKDTDHQIIFKKNGRLGSYLNGNGDFIEGNDVDIAETLLSGQHTITAVASDSGTTFYIDGEYFGDIAQKSTHNIYAIGNYNDGGQLFAERLDNVQIHSRALTEDEVIEVSNGQRVSDGLEAYYDFEGANDAERIRDKSGKDRHLTPVGVTFGDYPESTTNTGKVTWSAKGIENFSYNPYTGPLKKNYGNGWNSGTFSNESFVNDGGVYFEATEINTSRMVGLSDSDDNEHYTSIEYAIYLKDNHDIVIWEFGANRGKWTTYKKNDAFSIRREGSQIKYYKNSKLFYTSPKPVTAATALHVDTAFSTDGSTIRDIKLIDSSTVLIGYQYYRFKPSKIRNLEKLEEVGIQPRVQLSELTFFKDLYPSDSDPSLGAFVYNNRGVNLGQGPVNVNDGDVETQWADANTGNLVYQFGYPINMVAYSLTTASNLRASDPVRWVVEGSNDYDPSNGDDADWHLLDDRSAVDFPTPLPRQTSTRKIALLKNTVTWENNDGTPNPRFSFNGATMIKIDGGDSQISVVSNESFANDGGLYFVATETDTTRDLGLFGLSVLGLDYIIKLSDDGTFSTPASDYSDVYKTGDVFSIRREGSDIKMYHNNDVFHNLKLESEDDTDISLRIVGSFKDEGSSIANIQ
jgi:hypothetical protein